MNNGAFDDRDNARRHVKHWMQNHTPGDYTIVNLLGLARKMVADDYEPVDDIRVQWAETSYGILRGIVEFAADQLSAELGRSGRERAISGVGLDSRTAQASALTMCAANALPYRTAEARRLLSDALELLGPAYASDMEPSVHVQRAQTAISLALMMMTNPSRTSGRSVAV
jgi:hypothetical protein